MPAAALRAIPHMQGHSMQYRQDYLTFDDALTMGTRKCARTCKSPRDSLILRDVGDAMTAAKTLHFNFRSEP